MRKTILIALFVLGVVTPSAAQDPVADSVTSALQAFFGGGGEIPVRDGGVRGTTAAIKGDTAIEVIKQTAMLIDMLLQAVIGGASSNGTVGPLITEQSHVAADESALMYGSEIEDKWSEVFANDAIDTEGLWLESKIDRDARSLMTQRRLMRTLQLREEKFEEDLADLANADGAVTGAGGRNELLGALGGQLSRGNHQQLVTQSLLMSGFNMLAVDAAHRIADKTRAEAQERAFMRNYDRRPQLYPWRDEGLR